MNKFNHEGYIDLTAYEALKTIEQSERRYMPLVYIASPFRGDIAQNTKNAEAYCRYAVRNNCIPLAPHLHYPRFMSEDNPRERELGIRFALILLAKCDELWVMGDVISEGMAKEIKKAKRKNMVIRRFNSACKEVVFDGA